MTPSPTALPCAGSPADCGNRSPVDAAGLRAWHATVVPAFGTWLQGRFPDVRLPEQAMLPLHDADIRLRDAAYRDRQDADLDALIARLEEGELPADDGCSGFSKPLHRLITFALLAFAVAMVPPPLVDVHAACTWMNARSAS